jgi:hypothetical protein
LNIADTLYTSGESEELKAVDPTITAQITIDKINPVSNMSYRCPPPFLRSA